jgi:hypothetical protein
MIECSIDQSSYLSLRTGVKPPLEDADSAVRRRTVAPASLEERAWWSSMEEIPERHYN